MMSEEEKREKEEVMVGNRPDAVLGILMNKVPVRQSVLYEMALEQSMTFTKVYGQAFWKTDMPALIEKLMEKGWVQQMGTQGVKYVMITDKGLEEIRARKDPKYRMKRAKIQAGRLLHMVLNWRGETFTNELDFDDNLPVDSYSHKRNETLKQNLRAAINILGTEEYNKLRKKVLINYLVRELALRSEGYRESERSLRDVELIRTMLEQQDVELSMDHIKRRVDDYVRHKRAREYRYEIDLLRRIHPDWTEDQIEQAAYGRINRDRQPQPELPEELKQRATCYLCGTSIHRNEAVVLADNMAKNVGVESLSVCCRCYDFLKKVEVMHGVSNK